MFGRQCLIVIGGLVTPRGIETNYHDRIVIR